MEKLKQYSVTELRAELARRKQEAIKNRAGKFLERLSKDIEKGRLDTFSAEGDPWSGSYSIRFDVIK